MHPLFSWMEKTRGERAEIFFPFPNLKGKALSSLFANFIVKGGDRGPPISLRGGADCLSWSPGSPERVGGEESVRGGSSSAEGGGCYPAVVQRLPSANRGKRHFTIILRLLFFLFFTLLSSIGG